MTIGHGRGAHLREIDLPDFGMPEHMPDWCHRTAP